MIHDFVLVQDIILDPETRKSVAVIRNGKVFRNDQEGAQIATVVGSFLYDLDGHLIGNLQAGRVNHPSAQSIGITNRV